ncbi:hypothetical protein [Actinoplanes sp. NPDC049118]|uniref:hypothetical protein n=1 Tax=Actinoplanes sp. NPDC049118 TaxID=3155769 RepID=UPI0033E27705
MNESAGVVNGVPMQEKAKLLAGETPGLAVVAEQVLGAPAGDLPAKRELRQKPATVVAATPGRTEIRRRKRIDLLCGQG